ncbi:caspase domain-containing protein [Lactarius quietus]|nr:caspase domain-containing protein [Lactarius quietus]
MGNFVSSSATSCPTTTPSPPSTSSEHRKDRTTLTSTLTAHTPRLAHLLRSSSIAGSRIHLDDIEEGLSMPTNDTSTRGSRTDTDVLDGRRRALLIGIAYHGELLNTHKDVDRYRDVLLGTYGYRPEDVVILKDDPALPAHLQPTRENILRELRHLVADAAPGDRFTFLYSGHSNQQRSKGLNEEDFKDEYLITIDDEIVVDNELNDILVKPLPAGCSLYALLDTCHSGALLDLPHSHCNSVKNAASIEDPVFSEATAAASPPLRTAIANVLAWRKPSARSVLPVFVSIPLSIDAPTEVCANPESKKPTWETYDISQTQIVCSLLELPLYKELNCKFSATTRELHELTRSEKKAAGAARAYDYGEDEKKRHSGAELGGKAVVCGC